MYDNGGNITEEKVYDTSGSTPVLSATNTYTYGDNSWGDLLTGYNGDTITYDEIGNPLNYRDGISFTWGNGRQLQSYTKGNTNISYTYDSSGMRLSKTIGGTTHTYLYNSGLLIQERIGNQKLDYSYTSSGQILSVKYTADVNSNETPVYYYYALNSRGDVVGLYDHEGNLYAKYTYDVWGNPVSVTNANDVEITSPTDFANIQPLRYRSYYYDSDTGFYYLQSRYYDPVTHRFINADRQLNDDIFGNNLFTYCNNNPVVYSDPEGHFWLSAVLVVVAAVVVAAICTSSSNTKASSYNATRPNTGDPNSTYHAPNGDKRTYGSDGKPQQDYDHNDHGNPKNHPHDENGGHYHDWDWSDNKPWPGNSPRGPAYVPIVGIALVTVCSIGMAIVAVDDMSGVGVVDDVLFAPLGAGISEGIIMIFGG